MAKLSTDSLSIQFLDQFVLAEDLLPFKNEEIITLDQELTAYEQIFINPNVERSLISKNVLLASFAISKAENSTLTLSEAKEVYDLIVHNQDYDFIAKKIKLGKKLTQKNYERLEFFNIARVFKEINARQFKLAELTSDFIKNIHLELTKGLDIFGRYLPSFEVYKSGKWRDNDFIRVDNYVPSPRILIVEGVNELIEWLKKNFSITNVAVFHTALYALHPFCNGNKRVCRVLEHILLRALGINHKNLYSTSYYYHQEKERYYKYLLYSLERKNFNHFTSFILEAVVLSIIAVLKTSLETKRDAYLVRAEIDDKIKFILRPLIKRHEIQFKTLLKMQNKKIARQTFVTYLQKAGQAGLVVRRALGKAVYYSLNLDAPEKEVLAKWINLAKSRLDYIPDEIKLSI